MGRSNAFHLMKVPENPASFNLLPNSPHRT